MKRSVGLEYHPPNKLYDTWSRDIYTANRLSHPNILRASQEETTNVSNVKFTEEHLVEGIYDLCCAVHYLHRFGVLHLNITKSAIYVDSRKLSPKNGRKKFYVGGFSDSVRVDDASEGFLSASRPEIATKIYQPPEVLYSMVHGKEVVYNDKVDIWSLGAVILDMLIRFVNRIPGEYKSYLGPCTGEVLDEVLRRSCGENRLTSLLKEKRPAGKANNAKLFSREALLVELLDKMLDPDPKQRYNSRQVLRHPFFAPLKRRCEKGTVVNPIIDINFKHEEEHRNLLNLLILIFRVAYSSIPVEFMFLAIDIFKRAAAIFNWQNVATSEELIARVFLCAKLSLVFGRWGETWNLTKRDIQRIIIWGASKYSLPANLDKFLPRNLRDADTVLLEEAEYVDHILESKIMSYLENIVNLNNFYFASVDLESLKQTFNTIILSADPTLYGRTDLCTWVALLEEKISKKRNGAPGESKDVSVKNFFTA